MELVEDYDLDIAYHLCKANFVADALSRKRAASSQEQDMESLVSEISTGESDVGLVDASKAAGSEYHVSVNGTILVHGQVCVSNDEGQRQKILKEVHSSKFSVYQGATKIYRDLKRYYHWAGMKRDVAS
ncbi:PREDICTED: uncharacterized protein LOC104728151 [Camelina sativa]|uniref:Uncharacterized protein LOC104728151 n=1 Tax=Camelina sativa TaxID=90675 RepID=A0ABM0USD7_CAMSA|nr:PREDICTED: uncharacterized protein LOC104728151 [Camelina sativa]